ARAVSHDAQRVMLARWQSWTLSGLAALAGALAVGGFGHELVWLLVAPGSGWLTAAAAKAGWGALLASAVSAAFTAYKSLPSGRAKDSSEGVGRLSALVLRVAPYLVLAVLAALLAWVGHALVIAWHRREADLPPTATLVLAG